MNNFDKELLLNDINDLVQENLQANLNPESTINEFLNDYSRILNYHAPIRSQTRKEVRFNQKPWLNKEILKDIKTKNELYKQCYKKDDPVLIAKYKMFSNELTSKKNCKAKLLY